MQVSDAIRDGRPVVALESTIVTHGMPYPHNLEMALKVEKIIEEEGAVPATVALLGGRPHVGLDSKQLEHLATSRNTVKVSRRDMAHVMANEMDGGTTVSGNTYPAFLRFQIENFAKKKTLNLSEESISDVNKTHKIPGDALEQSPISPP